MQSLWRTVWRFLKELTIELPYDPAIPFLGTYLKKKKPKRHILKDRYTSVFAATLFTIAKTWKQSVFPSTAEWIKSMKCGCIHTHTDTHTDTHTHTYTYNGTPLSRKKRMIFCHLQQHGCTWRVYYVKQNTSDRER